MNPAKVLSALRPGAAYICNGPNYEGLEWKEPPVRDGGQPKPTKAEWDEEWERQIRISHLEQYKFKRLHEYPPIVDYIDGVVKNDQEQVQNYLDACRAVKLKYPRPPELDEMGA